MKRGDLAVDSFFPHVYGESKQRDTSETNVFSSFPVLLMEQKTIRDEPAQLGPSHS